ncbi:MAG: hypothetical protein LBR16_04770 [Treponema sp.]|nr:hypothetical protein [Treponema sp.]
MNKDVFRFPIECIPRAPRWRNYVDIWTKAESVPNELREAARIDGLSEYGIWLRSFISQYSSEYGLIMAASVIALIPVLVIFLSLQRYFVQGVASSGLKG